MGVPSRSQSSRWHSSPGHWDIQAPSTHQGMDHEKDTFSKIGTKHASLACDSQKFLDDFAESNQLTEEVVQKAEYIVHVWAGAKSKPESRPFDQDRFECHIRVRTTKQMEPHTTPSKHTHTSSVILGHIQKSFVVVPSWWHPLDFRSNKQWLHD